MDWLSRKQRLKTFDHNTCNNSLPLKNLRFICSHYTAYLYKSADSFDRCSATHHPDIYQTDNQTVSCHDNPVDETAQMERFLIIPLKLLPDTRKEHRNNGSGKNDGR